MTICERQKNAKVVRRESPQAWDPVFTHKTEGFRHLRFILGGKEVESVESAARFTSIRHPSIVIQLQVPREFILLIPST